MKLITRLFALALIILPLLSVAQEGFTVNIRLKGLGNHDIRVFHQKNGKYKTDTLKNTGSDLFVWK